MDGNIKINFDTDWTEVAKLRDEIRKLESDLKRIDAVKNPDAAKAVVAEIDATKKKMKELVSEAEFAKQRTTELGQSLLNFAQDLPHAFSGTDAFFSTLKTHVPEILNQILLLRAANAQLAAEGKATIPIWKQLGKSMFSWQTLLVAAISALITYAPTFIKWIKEMNQSQDELLNNSINDHFEQNASSMAKQISTLRELQKAWNDLGDDLKRKEEFITNNKKKIDTLETSINTVGEAEDLFVNRTSEYIEALKLRAKATAASELAIEKYKEAIVKSNKAEREKAKGPSWWDKVTSVLVTGALAANNEFSKGYIKESDVSAQAYKNARDTKNQRDADKDFAEAEALHTQSENYRKEFNGLFSFNDDDASDAKRKALERHKEMANELFNLQQDNAQKRINQIADEGQKNRQQIELNYKKQIDLIEQQEKKWKQSQKGGKLTNVQQETIDEAKALAGSEKEIGLKKITDDEQNIEKEKKEKDAETEEEDLKAKLESMRNYLKEYGTFQQQKLAIAQEYAEKIKKAEGNEYEVKRLEKQQAAAEASIEFKALKTEIDFPTVFGEFGGMFREVVSSALDKAEAFKNTDAFKNADSSQKQEVNDAINSMKKSLGGTSTLNFKKLGQEIKDYQSSLNTLTHLTEVETDKQNKLKQAEDARQKVMETGTEAEKKAAEEAVVIAKQNAETAAENVKSQKEIVEANKQTMSGTANNLSTTMKDVVGGLSQLSSGSLSGAFGGVLQAGSALSDKFSSLVEQSKSIPIVGWILSIIDIFKDGLSLLIGSLLDTIFNAVSGIIDDIFSGDLFVTIGKSLMTGLSKIFDAISFGGFSSLVDSIHGGNAKETAEAIERLNKRNDTLEKSIDRLTKVMDKVAGRESIAAYEQAYKYQEENNDNLLEIAQKQAGYSGSHRSWNYRMSWSSDQLKWAQENVDKNFSGTSSLWGLTPEQMSKLLSNVDIYEHIGNTGKGGYGWRVMEKLEDYADQAGNLDELTSKINESLMQLSFDGLRDGFLSSLMDMDKDAKSFSEDFSEYMQKALLNFALGEDFDKGLKDWYDGIADLMKAQDGKLTHQQLEDAREKYDQMAQDAMIVRDQIAELTGYTGSDSSINIGITLDDVKNALDDLVTSVDATFEDISNSFEDHMRKAILEMVKSQYLNKELEKWYASFSDYVSSGDALTEAEVNALRKKYEEIVNESRDMYQTAAEIIGISLGEEVNIGVTFDELSNALNSLVTSVDMTFADISNSFEDHMKKAILQLVQSQYLNGELEKWYASFSTYASSGTLTKDEVNILKKEYEEIVNGARNMYESAAEIAGISLDGATTQQGATQQGFETMSQDTASELNGRFTALQIAGEEIKNQNLLQTEIMAQSGYKLDAILVAEAEQINIADETRDLIVNSYLELQSIRENTGAIVKPIKNMSEKLDTIERKIQSL